MKIRDMAIPIHVDNETRKRLQLISFTIYKYGFVSTLEMAEELSMEHGIKRSKSEMRADYRLLGLE